MGDSTRGTTRNGLPGNVIPFPGDRSGPLMHPAFFKPVALVVPAPPTVVPLLTLRLELDDADPPVQRTLELAGDLTLDAVHVVLQEAMGWWDSHLHGFRRPDETQRFLTAYDIEEGDEGVAEADVRLDQLLRAVGDSLFYEYDFGDGWGHTLVVESIRALRAADPPARLLDGRGACPPEDVGGVLHYNDIADALRGRPGAPELSGEILDWLPEGFDPDAFDLVAAQDAVARALDTLAVPADLPPGVSEVVTLADRGGRRQLLSAVAAAQEDLSSSVEVVRAAVRPWATLLDVVGDGVTLTQAGYLPPAVVRELFDALGLADHWIGKGNREDHTRPVAELRHGAREFGLVRVSKGRLLPTKKGQALRQDPQELLRHVASRLSAGTEDFERHVGVIALLLAAAGRTSHYDTANEVAALLFACGWQTPDGPPRSADAAYLMVPTWGVLDLVTDVRARRLLARTALGL